MPLKPAAGCACVLILTAGLLLGREPERARSEAPAATDAGISVYFSPDGGCTAALVARINAARRTVDVQAYSFTSTEIARALAAAKARGVKVRVILDNLCAR